MRVAHRQARPSAQRWMGCSRSKSMDSNEIDTDENETHHKEPLTSSANQLTSSQLLIGPVCTLVLILWLNFKFE